MRGNDYRDSDGRGSEGRGSEGRRGGDRRGRSGGSRSGGNGGGGGRGRGNGRRGSGRGRGGGRGRYNSRGRDGGRGGYNGRGRGRRHHGGTAESGNKRERIQVESGALVLIDQFMLANPQVLDGLRDLLDEDPSAKDKLVSDFGGTVVELEPDTYRIKRDPFDSTIVIHRDGESSEVNTEEESKNDPAGRVFIDTRCLAMVDRELLDDISLLEKYRQLWITGKDKACRDLLRDNGGAVRYGFERFGDELAVYLNQDENLVALWPDVIESAPTSDSDDSEAASSESADDSEAESE